MAGAYDAVTVCFGLHLIPDAPALGRVLKEIRRVLKPGGVCVATLWDSVPIVDSCTRTMEDLTGEPLTSIINQPWLPTISTHHLYLLTTHHLPRVTCTDDTSQASLG